MKSFIFASAIAVMATPAHAAPIPLVSDASAGFECILPDGSSCTLTAVAPHPYWQAPVGNA